MIPGAPNSQAVIHLDDSQSGFFLVESNRDQPCEILIRRIENPVHAPGMTTASARTDAACESGIVVPQPGGDSNGDGPSLSLNSRISARPVFRRDSLWIPLEISQPQAGGVRSGILFVQLDVSNWPEARIVQSAVISKPGFWYFMPAITVNEEGNVAIAFACTDGSNPISICYTGRLASDELNTMRPVVEMKAGIADPLSYGRCPVQENWGDYFGAALDPADGSAWIIGEYAQGSCWATWVGNLDWATAPSE
jgi:hypothetical protein